ncbi:hypothetical protein [Novosphingobium sp. ST904]|uniref:hypothetical protein n=1 Tax=Novosphingobium sp. ST904 TaxID=1684385 RepID=UPI0006C862AA|nr:hypothetical protein [Novosphingobium sp. ST904]TCM40071.1 hypothetical protein EDF59_105311 [Novosphingobium sp. ST904]
MATREATAHGYTRHEARRHIERTFNSAVLEALAGIDLADLQVTVLIGENGNPPALAVICDSIGQIDMGWIEKSNVLSGALFSSVAPLSWRATAYRALLQSIGHALPVMSFEDLFEEVSAYYWDGETEDEAARASLMQWRGHDPADLDDMPMPSGLKAQRPDWMLTENAAPLKQLPRDLCMRLRALRKAVEAISDVDRASNAWVCEFDQVAHYLPGYQDVSYLPPMTLVPFDHFARELDDVCQVGMQEGFMNVAGLRPITDVAMIDAWFTSLRLGADLLRAAQTLIDFDPAKPRG